MTAPSTTHWTRPCARAPSKLALTAWRTEDDAVRRFSYRELARMADRIAVGLARLGGPPRRGGLPAAQLVAVHAAYLACTRIGAVMNPLMHIFRERELASCCATARPRW
jgi:cyclohexanecarboxylate-CoA ligase